MSNVTNINVRTDAALKDEFAHVVEQLGLTVSSAINVFMRATVQRQGIPFQLKLPPRLTEDEREALALLNDPNAETFLSAHELAEADGWYK